MNAVVIDTETTGTGDTAKVIEFACSVPLDEPFRLKHEEVPLSVAVRCERYSPGDEPIAFGAMAAHHIIEDDLRDLETFPGFNFPSSIGYLIGHNIDFDWRMLNSPNLKRICTLAIARVLWPHIDSHALSALVYHLHDHRRTARELLQRAHSAEADVMLLLHVVLPAILKSYGSRVSDWESLWLLSEEARVPLTMTFGKHKGMLIRDVPRDYKQWLLRQDDVDPYLVIALRERK